jgi:hypothetical protein
MSTTEDIMKKQSMPLWCALAGLGVLGLILSGCASEVRRTGSTRAGDVLYRDAAHDLMARAKARQHCGKVDAIHTQTLQEIPPGATGGSSYAPKYGSVMERWTVSLCNTQVPYRVTFTADGAGGTFFSTVQE